MPRAAEASRLLLRAAAAQRAWWAAASPATAAAPGHALLPRPWWAAAPTASTGLSGALPPAANHAPSFASSAEAAARARRLAAAQARRQQQHERAAARLARAGGGGAALTTPHHHRDTAPTTAANTPTTPIDPGSLSRTDALAVAPAVAHPALIVTRAIEWGTVVFGFEQANKYTVYDQDGQIVCLIAEDVTGLGNALGRQLLRTRRAFTATVLSPQDGSVLFRVRRPAYLVSSTTYVETADGSPVGEVRQRWHPLRRNFDLYVGREQYARISGPLLAWEFQLTDASGRPLALIDRNFQGFAKELFTDAGKYVVHFGLPPDESAAVATRTLEARSGRTGFGGVPPLQITGGGGASAAPSSATSPTTTAPPTDAVAVIPQVTGGQLAVARPLALDERMVALAAAVAIDFAFFSQHSHTSGMFAPPLLFPMPLPGGGGVGGPAAEEAGSGEGATPVDGGAGAGGVAGGGEGAGGFGGGTAASGGGSGGQEAGGMGGGGEADSGWSWDDQGSGSGGSGGGDSGWSPWGGGDGDGGDFDDDGGGEGGAVGSVVRGLWRVFGDDD